jgi:hypothetical protein
MSKTRILPLYLLYWSLLVLYLIIWGNLSCEYPAGFDDGAFYSMAYAHNAGLNFYDGIVDSKPPLLIYLTSLGFRLSPSICFIKWLSVSMFGVLILVVYLTLRYTSGRSDIACFGATLIATNWSLRHYGVVELSQSYWQAMLSLFSLAAVFGALSIHQHIPKFNASHRILAYVSLFFGGSIWAIAFYTKQQSIVVLPAVVALILLYSWPFQTLKERFYYLSIFAIGAVGSVLLLYYPILGNSPVAESYKYIFLSNMGNNIALNDYGWWSGKGSALILILSASARIPIIAFIGFEAQALIIKLVRIALGRLDRSVASLTMQCLYRHEAPATGKGRRGALVIAMSVWALSAVVFYFLHDRAQPHYLLELGVILAVLIPLIVSAGRYSPVGVMSINIMILGAISVWHGVATDPIGAAVRDKWKADRHVAEVIGKSTDKEDKMLLFTNPVLYYLADRLPASRFPFFVGAWNTPLMMPEYQRATLNGLTAESTKVVVVHDRILQEMPEWLRRLVVEELTSRYRALAFESKDVMFGMTQIYVRTESIVSSPEK